MTKNEKTSGSPSVAPLVSVITPVYNCSQFIGKTVESVFEQTCGDWELILIDDCSTDNSAEICRSYADLDSRVSLLINDRNSGAAKSRNRGIRAARGRFIAFCDSDDTWLPGKLEIQIRVLLSSEAAVCFSSYYKVGNIPIQHERIVLAAPVVDYEMQKKSNFVGCSTAVYDSAKCGKVEMPDFRKRQDYGLWLSILKQGHIAVGVKEPLVLYRVRKGSVSSDKLSAAKYHWLVLRRVTGDSFFKSIWFFAHYAIRGLVKSRI